MINTSVNIKVNYNSNLCSNLNTSANVSATSQFLLYKNWSIRESRSSSTSFYCLLTWIEDFAIRIQLEIWKEIEIRRGYIGSIWWMFVLTNLRTNMQPGVTLVKENHLPSEVVSLFFSTGITKFDWFVAVYCTADQLIFCLLVRYSL